ncbi:MAG: threonine aldolase family protein [Actinomycetota bacterium]
MSAPWRGFASDNYAGAHPEVLEAIVRANVGHAVAYGEDAETARLADLVRDHFGSQAEVFPVFNGTGANVVALSAICRPWEAVICSDTAHVNVDEGGAPEKVAGLKLWTTPTADGLLTPEAIDLHAVRFGDVHRAQQAVVTVTQSSELGTASSPEQLGALVDHVHGLGMKVHLDGARLANAAAGLNVDLRAITTDVGIDVLSLGGTKNGALGAEAVVVLDPGLAHAVPFLRKSSMQLASKMRFVSAQLCALLTDDLWRRNASHANAMAQRLLEGVKQIPGVTIARRVDANAVFAYLPRDVTARLQQHYRFYEWDERTGEVRWMCSWDTTPEDVDGFVAAISREMGA